GPGRRGCGHRVLDGVRPRGPEDVGGGGQPVFDAVRGDRSHRRDRQAPDELMWSRPLLYERLTWPEVRRAASEDRVCLIPVATLEDHGPHLPVDTDARIITEISRRAAEEAADQIVLLPTIPHGYDPHHMDFPGPISIGRAT